MKLKDFADVAVYNKYWVGAYDEPGSRLYEEFESVDKEKLNHYAECAVSGVWVLDEDTMCVSVIIE